ncbi:hypothetical protein JI735_34395 (plasmid) [Paenibacillus sonchi]|uniref:Uncharacterized protein n=2 Tax=Paenibacillus sonchi TaxID=373687 RepID=A0A974SFE5_9BACL|nr:hypothetical protein [Paenibacillus sonchi]QQZ64528.1 hypothetical protein JI735_34395 [Paenibacillus sonchi]
MYADEFNWILMTPEEREAAVKDYSDARKLLARRRYRELKNMKPILYVFPSGKKTNEFLKSIAKRCRGSRSYTTTQSLQDFA